jgi:hypothetical protein
MMMDEFDITGFVNFPNPYSQNIKKLNTGKTFIYLVAIDFESEQFSKVTLETGGAFVSDDVSPKRHIDTSKLSVNDLVNLMQSESNVDINTNKPFVSSILLGWSNFSYQLTNDIQPWICSFRELTEEGKKLYYSFKKLNYDKEIRILTFNKI